MSEPLDWAEAAPRSLRFDDIYFSPTDGLAETCAVFLQGCGLPQAWDGRRGFTVGELGFGTGLNILALIALWRDTRPSSDAVLHVFSVEAFPISRSDAARALSAWPTLSNIAAPLLEAWPAGRKGFHRIEWPEDGVILDLAVMEVEAALSAWSGRADAWFLDGFAPSKNPDMWRPEVQAGLAARSNPGARVATFSVAGVVRRGLQAAGFEIERAPGFGRKKERLQGRLPTVDGAGALAAIPPPTVAIIGAGIAGAALARAFARLGQAVTVIDSGGVGSGASGNPSALVTPRLDAGLGPIAALYAQAFARSVQLYRQDAPDAILAEGALQLAVHDRDGRRFDKIVGWDGFDPGAIERLDEGASAAALNEAASTQSLRLQDALVVEPELILRRWLSKPPLDREIAKIERAGRRWRLLDAAGTVVMEADIVCLAAGPASARLMDGVPLRPVRGQTSFTGGVTFSGVSAAFGGYAVPTRGGVLFGATHDRDDWGVEVRPADDARNLAALREGRPALANRLDGVALTARASLRAMAPDHLPLAGAVRDRPGIYVLSGLGGRGFTLAPLLAEAIAAKALDRPSPLPRNLADLAAPARFGEP